MNEHKKQLIGIPLVLLAGCLWGLSGVLGQLLFQSTDISIGYVSTIRMLVSGVGILSICIIKNDSSMFAIWKNKNAMIRLFFFAIAGVMSVQYTYFSAIAASNAATGTVLQYTYPILMLLYTSLYMKKMPSTQEIFAIISAFLGIVLISTHGNLHTLSISKAALAWGLSSAVAFVIYTVSPQKLHNHYSIFAVTGWGFLLAGILMCIITKSYAVHVSFTPYSALLVTAIAIFGTLIPFLIYGFGVRLLGNVKASLFATVEPVVSAILAFFLANVTFTKIDILGFVCILGAIQVVAMQAVRKSNA
ncbi:permeases of the drug/metabolite transporter (DMT) superfamily [Clostridium sp. CAG:590]|nr:permeases of the drug/metabolite transporter (DMT) superfamily [Clostridium sp. CAG:590]